MGSLSERNQPERNQPDRNQSHRNQSHRNQSDRNQSEKHYLLKRILLLLLIGLPFVGFLIFDDFFLFIRRSPIEAIGLFLLYGLLLLLFSFVANFWQQAEDYTAVRFLMRTIKRIKALLSPHRKKYVQYLIYRYRDFDVKGLSTQGIFALLLEDVFIELKIAPQATHHATVDPLHVSEELRDGNHDVWTFLSAEHLERHDLAIIGPPGSGKTTLLQHTVLSLVSGKTRVLNALSDKLPMLLFLRNHTQVIGKKLDYTLAEAARFALLIGNMSDPPPNHWFEKYLQRGECLVMLDGLDEVADDTTRQGVVKWVEAQMRRYPKNRFIVTSRPFGYRSNPLRDVMVLEVQPFTLKQVRSFVERWYLANEIKSFQKDDPGVRMKALEGAEDLIQRIRHTPSLSALAVNPLLLTMISTVHRYRSSLPERRVELYAEICDAFLGKRQEARGMTMSLTPAQKQSVLQPLAYDMMVNEQRKISHEVAIEAITPSLKLVNPRLDPAEFLSLIENSSGLLLEREAGQYSFAHLTFQEYLAATHVLDQQLEAELLLQIEDTWWHETIRLYCARTDATKVIATCLRQESPSIPALTLALDCGNEALKVQPYIRHKLQTILQKGVEESDPERRRLVAEALLALRLNRMKRVKENLYVDDSLLTNAEYQLFIDDKRATGHYFQPDHWSQHQFILGQGRKAIVGVRPSDTEAFCAWLTERDTEGWRYRIPYSGECEPLGKADKVNLAAHLIHKSLEKKEKAGKSGAFFSSTAYWTRHDNKSSYLLEGQPSIELPLTRLESRLRDDCQRANDRERARTLDRDLDLDFERTFDRELGQLLGDTRDLALALAMELTRDKKLAHARSLTLNLSHALTHALEHTLELDRNLSRDIMRVQDIERVLTHAHEVEQHLASQLKQKLARHRELERARDIIRHVNDIRARAISRALSRALAQIRKDALKPGYNAARSRNFAEEFNLAQAIEQARSIEPKIDNRTRVQAIQRARQLERALNLDHILGHDRRFVHKAIKSDDTSFLRWYARFILWLITEYLLNMLDQQERPRTFMDSFLRREKDQYWQEEVQELADNYFNLYIDLAILEERIAGKIPAFEGIRIVKERKSER